MGKMKIGIYCYFFADIFTKVFLKCLMSGPLPNIYFSLPEQCSQRAIILHLVAALASASTNV